MNRNSILSSTNQTRNSIIEVQTLFVGGGPATLGVISHAY